MLILTQWKSEIINLDNMETVFAEQNAKHGGCYIFVRGTSGKSEVLGQYKDEARAKEVLREIVGAYEIMVPNVVYKMPDA